MATQGDGSAGCLQTLGCLGVVIGLPVIGVLALVNPVIAVVVLVGAAAVSRSKTQAKKETKRVLSAYDEALRRAFINGNQALPFATGH